jgi:hypothetical protein
MTEPTDQPPTPPPPPPSGQPGGAYYPPPPPMPYAGQGAVPPVRRNGMGTAALILAIIALLICWIPFVGFLGLILGIVAMILGFVGRGRAKRGEANNSGVALGGIVLGFFAVLGAIAASAIFFFIIKESGGGDFIDCMNKAGQDQNAQQACADQFQHHLETRFSMTLTNTPSP